MYTRKFAMLKMWCKIINYGKENNHWRSLKMTAVERRAWNVLKKRRDSIVYAPRFKLYAPRLGGVVIE